MLKSGFDVLTCSLVFLNYSLFVLHCSQVVLNCICQPRMTLMHQDLHVSQQWEVIKFWYARMEERLLGRG